MIIKNDRGDVFEDFIITPESNIADFQPLTHSLIVVSHNDTYLIIYNSAKNNWELPGGMIDAGESPRDCAIRELKEETGQTAERIIFKGIMKFKLMPNQWNKATRIEFGSLYYGTINDIAQFEPNEEATEICFWNPRDDLDNFDLIDKKIIELVKAGTDTVFTEPVKIFV